MDDLTAFLSARLKELESAALESKNAPPGAMRYLDADQWTLALSWEADADLVLRRVKAVRALLKLADEATELDRPYLSDRILRISAAIWDDHPDYRPEWKP